MKIKVLAFVVALLAAVTAFAVQPKYIFYYIGDGMGMGPVQAAQNYNRIVLGNDQLLTMMQFSVAGMAFTYSANNDITDSAAAGTALASGYKTNNGMLGMNADTVAVNSIAKILFDRGFGVGLVTSVSPDDATPGAFYAHVPQRKMQYDVDCHMAECGYQFVAGSGLNGLYKNDKPTDVLDRYAANGVQIVRGPEGIAKINSDRVLLLSNENVPVGNIGYTIDSIPGRLNLPDMAEACLAQLQKTSPDGFFMMVEGGNIDHCLHGNDAGTSIKEILNFDKAIAVAYEFYKKHPQETLIIVTADHDTGGLTLVKPKESKGGIKNLNYQRISKDTFSDYCKSLLKTRNIYTWEDMKQYMKDNLGLFSHIAVSEKRETKLKEMFDRTFGQRNSVDQETLYANYNAFSVEVFNLLNRDSGIHFSTTSHSGNPVPIFAVGPGAYQFSRLKNNIEIPKTILRIVTGE